MTESTMPTARKKASILLAAFQAELATFDPTDGHDDEETRAENKLCWDKALIAHIDSSFNGPFLVARYNCHARAKEEEKRLKKQHPDITISRYYFIHQDTDTIPRGKRSKWQESDLELISALLIQQDAQYHNIHGDNSHRFKTYKSLRN